MQNTAGQVLFLNGIDNLDCAYFDDTHGVVGATWIVDVEASGKLDDNHFVLDFGILKSTVKNALKETADHALVTPKHSKRVTIEDREGNNVHLKATTLESETWSYEGPREALYMLDTKSFSLSALEEQLSKDIKAALPDTIDHFAIHLRLENFSGTQAHYTYTHGLPGHAGLCQRVFHGHRSKVEVFINDQRSNEMEYHIADELFLKQVHIATPEQLASHASYPLGKRLSEENSIELKYSGSFGEYTASIPGKRLLLVEEETSIECISQFLCYYVKDKHPKDKITVRAFEGHGKGCQFTLDA